MPCAIKNFQKTVAVCVVSLLCALPLHAADYSSGVIAKVLKKSTTTGIGQKITYPVTDNAEVTAMEVTINPGAETGWHSHPVPVYAYVIAGTLDIEFGEGKKLTFTAGDAIFEALNARHNGRNNGSEPVRLAVFYVGAQGVPNVIKQGL